MTTRDVKARIQVPGSNFVHIRMDDSKIDNENIPCKEFSISDDVLNIADSAAVTISNVNGEHINKSSGELRFREGQKVTMDVSDPDVAAGKWVRHFTGRITNITTKSDLGGSDVVLSMMDLGWHLTSCDAYPLYREGKDKGKHVQIKHKTFKQLIKALIDPSWGFPTDPDGSATVEAFNDTNKNLKHGRQVIIQEHKPVLGAVLPFIQIEPGQKPFEILSLYAAREGVLINVGADGRLIFFRPHYDEQPLYTAEYHGTNDSASSKNNVEGSPSLQRGIDGLFSEVQCWSTVTIPPEVANSDNPNEAFRHDGYIAGTNPLPFNRLCVFSDGEAINQTLRKNRAIWKQRMGLFNSWTYKVEFTGLSQAGAFFVSDTMISVHDTVNGVPKGVYYVQSVNRSVTSSGIKSSLVIKKPGFLNPALNALRLGGGAKKAAKETPAKK